MSLTVEQRQELKEKFGLLLREFVNNILEEEVSISVEDVHTTTINNVTENKKKVCVTFPLYAGGAFNILDLSAEKDLEDLQAFVDAGGLGMSHEDFDEITNFQNRVRQAQPMNLFDEITNFENQVRP